MRCPVKGCKEPADVLYDGVWTCVAHLGATTKDQLARHLTTERHGRIILATPYSEVRRWTREELDNIHLRFHVWPNEADDAKEA